MPLLASFAKSNPCAGAPSKGAGLVVLNSLNGEVLAAISYPYYDINTYSKDYDSLEQQKVNPHVNRAINKLYRPGSTFKTVIGTMALLNGTISPSTTFNCHQGAFPHMDCKRYSHSGTTSFYKAVERSCNNYFYNVAKTLGLDAITQYAPYFGIGVESGLEIYNEDGRVTNLEFYRKHGYQYYISELYQTGIGQAETYLTPLKMAVATSVIANHGKRFATHLIKEISSYDGKKIKYKSSPKILSFLKEKNNAYDEMLKGMHLVSLTKGEMFSKWNSSIKSGSPEYSSNKNVNNSAGVGFLPEENIVAALIIEDGNRAENFLATVFKTYQDLCNERKSNENSQQIDWNC